MNIEVLADSGSVAQMGIPAGRIRSDQALLLADCAAASRIDRAKHHTTKEGGVICA
jgi:hypothetical protein